MTTVLRRDVHVPNESDGFVFTSTALRGKGFFPFDEGWARALRGGELLPLAVEREDSANVRVVVGGPLEPAEEAEWVGRVTAALRVPDGQLVLCGGVEYVLEAEAWAEENARRVAVPPGDYRATVYCYASAPNGRRSRERAGSEEPLGAWFRRSRPGQVMPAWLHNVCVNDPQQDPGHQKQWKRAKEKRGADVVDFLLHLQPAGEPTAPAPVAPHGFLEATDVRLPGAFPLGLATRDLERGDDDD